MCLWQYEIFASVLPSSAQNELIFVQCMNCRFCCQDRSYSSFEIWGEFSVGAVRILKLEDLARSNLPSRGCHRSMIYCKNFPGFKSSFDYLFQVELIAFPIAWPVQELGAGVHGTSVEFVNKGKLFTMGSLPEPEQFIYHNVPLFLKFLLLTLSMM